MKDFDWNSFEGSRVGLEWSRRDLQNLEAALRLTPRRALAIQAGGNLGIFAKRLARDFDHVYTFEPDHYNFRALCKNAPEANIFKLQAALGEYPGPINFCLERRDGRKVTHEGTHHVATYVDQTGHVATLPGPVPMLRLDDLGFRFCDLLYLDVEGFELPALLGAAETIAHCRPVIAVEINKQSELAGFQPSDIVEAITRHGYRAAASVGSDRVFVPIGA
jgi:FkbM family methyltransferase